MQKDLIMQFATVIVKNDNGQVLLLRRSNHNKHYKNYWQLPEGKIEISKNESPIHTAIRELREETGISNRKLSLVSILPVLVRVGGQKILTIRAIFVTKSKKTICLSQDHDKYLWIKPKDLKGLKHVPGTKEVLEQLFLNL